MVCLDLLSSTLWSTNMLATIGDSAWLSMSLSIMVFINPHFVLVVPTYYVGKVLCSCFTLSANTRYVHNGQS